MYELAKKSRELLLKLPRDAALGLGRMIGLVLWLSPHRRQLAFKNIKSVFPERPNAELRSIVRQSFANLGLSIIEGLIAPSLFKLVKVKGLEHIGPEGGVVVAIHEGSWELYNAALAQKANYAILAKGQKEKNFDLFLNELREEYRLKVCFSLKELIRNLGRGYLIGMTMDHGAEDNALYTEFFSHLIPTPKGAVYMAKKFNKKIYPCFGWRNKGRHLVEIKPAIDPQAKEEAELLRELNQVFEADLRRHPAEYLWHYKRFKKKRDLDVVILNDGKQGHFKQASSFLSLLRQEPYQIRAKSIDIKYKSKNFRLISDFCALLSTKDCAGCGLCLKLALASKTCRALNASYADIVVSAGSETAPLNKIFSATVGARSVVILRPNIPLNRFDLCIIPEHDRISSENTVTIKGALYCPDAPQEKAAACRDFFKLSGDKKICFFLGGVLADKKEFMANLKIFVAKLKEFAAKRQYKILVSTSRRTPKEADRYLQKELSGFANSEALVFPNTANYDFVFEGFGWLADLVFVSSESISMVSEILALKRPCSAVALEKQDGKHKVFLQMIQKDVGLIRSPYSSIDKVKLKGSSVFESNKRAVKEAIKKLL